MDFESQIEKIAKYIRDREDKELALAFTNVVGSLLRDNGVFVKTSRHEFETDNETDKNKYIIKKEFGVSFDGLDFTEHDKEFKDEIKKLKSELSDVQKSADEYYNKCIDLTKHIAELESELEVKDNLLKIKNGLCGNNDELPIDPIEVAQTLINSAFEREASNLEKVLYKCGDIMTTERYSIDDLEQIAEHLLVYCKHNREDEE